MKKISIIIPCYNVEPYIDRCVNSLLAQTIGFDKLEVILVDDCSTKDNTWSKIQEIESKYPNNIIAIHLEKNMRLGAARNIGLQYSSSPYIMFVDADDWLETNCLKLMYETMLSKDYDIVTCNYYRDWGDNKKIPCQKNKMSFEINIHTFDERSNLIAQDSLQTKAWGKLIKKSLLSDNDITFPEGIFFEDIAWASLLYLYTKSAYILSDCLYHYFVNPSSAVLNKNQTYYNDVFKSNYIKWNQLINYCDFQYIQEAAEFDFLVDYYILALKMFGKRYTHIPIEAFEEMQLFIKQNIPYYKSNRYINTILKPEQSYLFNFIEAKMTTDTLIQLHSIIKGMNI